MSGFYVYILICADDTLYTGWTTNPARRLKTHNSGAGAKYTRGRLPVRMVYLEACECENSARRREFAIKAMSRVQKLKLIEGNSDETCLMER